MSEDRSGTHAGDARSLTGFLKVLFRRAMADRVPVLAAALSFFMMLSIVPVILLALAILGFAFSHMGYDVQHAARAAVSDLQRGIAQVLPGASVQDAFRQLAEQTDLENSIVGIINARGLALVSGILSLVWAAIQIVVNASPLVNQAFEARESRSWLQLRMLALGVTLVVSVLFLLSLIPISEPDLVRNLRIPWLGLPELTPMRVDWLFFLVALALNTSLFTFVYKVLPNTRVEWRDALVGGVSMAVLWELARKGFTVFLARSTNPLYGALGGVILLITWMYYTNILLLLGAEVSGLYRSVRVGAALPAEQDRHARALQAVREGRVEPLPLAGDEPQEDARSRSRRTMSRIRANVREARASMAHAAHNVATTRERHNAGRALEVGSAAADRREVAARPAQAERRLPLKAPEHQEVPQGDVALTPEEARRRARRISQQRIASSELRAGQYPPVERSKERASRAVGDIRRHLRSVGEAMERLKGAGSNNGTGGA